MKPVNNPGVIKIKGSFITLLLVICSQLLMACGSDSDSATTKIDLDKQQWLQKLDQGAEKWKAKAISNYQIVVSYHKTPWQPGELYDLTVKNGQAVQKSFKFIARGCCASETPSLSSLNKPTYPDAGAFTVQGLFELARSFKDSQWTKNTAFNIDFDTTYGFPKYILLDNNQYTDLGVYWTVESFKELP